MAEYAFDGHQCSAAALAKHTCLTAARWKELLDFASRAGLRVVFGLDLMHGSWDSNSNSNSNSNPRWRWDPSNAKSLLKATAALMAETPQPHGIAFGLGNEKEFTVSAADTAAAYGQLRATIDEIWPTTTSSSSSSSNRPHIVGPDINTRPDWLSQFLAALPAADTVDGVSLHLYPGYGRSVDLPDLLLNGRWLDFSHSYLDMHLRSLRRSKAAPATEMWVSETAAAWASGTAGVCDGFVSGFWWLDQLGMAATKGYAAMCRQCLVGGNYSLIDQLNANGLTPNPDYWSAWIHKQVVGTQMLGVEQVMPLMGNFDVDVRAYMACTPKGAPGYAEGAVTLIYINQDKANNKTLGIYQQSRIQEYLEEEVGGRRGEAARGEVARRGGGGGGLGAAPWGPTPPPFEPLPRLDFVLTAPGNNLLSRDVELNGRVLAVGSRQGGGRGEGRGRGGVDSGRAAADSITLPDLASLARHAGPNEAMMVVPPQSYGFAVYSNAKAPACMA